jgi:nucleotide-binding universal stress UspA family protein
MKKLLIALDDSASAMQAVEYAGRQFSGIGDLQIGLVHVLPNLPAIFWDEGHILSDEEKKERKKVVDKWIVDRKARMEPVFKKASEVLMKAGIREQQIATKSISDSTDVSESILEEAKDSGYQTVLVGRCNNPVKHLLGSVSGRIVNQGSGLAITVIG